MLQTPELGGPLIDWMLGLVIRPWQLAVYVMQFACFGSIE
jgi:hypothetical protein